MKDIKDNNKNPYKYQEHIRIQFESICEPLYNLGVDFFGYIKIFPDGSYLLTGPSHKEFIRQFCLNITNQGVSLTRELESSPIEKNHYSFSLSNIPSKRADPILHLYYSFDLWPLFCIYKNRSEFIETYCFAMNKNKHYAPTFYLNNLNILEHFCDYFNETATDIIDSTDKQKLGYFDQQFNLYNQGRENFQAQKIKQFLQETYIKKKELKTEENELFSSKEEMERINFLCSSESVREVSENLGISSLIIENSLHTFKSLNQIQSDTARAAEKSFIGTLSPRQKECLFLLTRGKSAKQIAQALGISHRTVETHMISLKNKMNCTTKNELIEKYFYRNEIKIYNY